MLNAFALALGQLGDRRILAVLAKSVALTLGLLALLGVIMLWLTGRTISFPSYAQIVGPILVVSLIIVCLWLLFRLVALAVLQLFGDEVVRAVEG